MKGVFCVGGRGTQGTYILRIALRDAARLALGRFQGGRVFDFPPGTYLYVGSALGCTGSSTLGRRLLRHACRREGKAHSLLPALEAFFALSPPARKRLHWHVDYLLELPQADLEAAFLFAYPHPLEARLSRFLLEFPEVQPHPPGAGAGDDPGGSHLLRVVAASLWWSRFPQVLNQWLQSLPETRSTA